MLVSRQLLVDDKLMPKHEQPVAEYLETISVSQAFLSEESVSEPSEREVNTQQAIISKTMRNFSTVSK